MELELGIQDTAAYRVIRQMTDHVWGSEVDLSDEDIVTICRSFWGSGGSWEALLGGDFRCVAALESSIESLVAPRLMLDSAVG